MERLALVAALVLLFSSSVAAQAPAEENSSGSPLDMLLSINPWILIAAGIILFLAANLAKYVAIALVILGIASLIVSAI